MRDKPMGAIYPGRVAGVGLRIRAAAALAGIFRWLRKFTPHTAMAPLLCGAGGFAAIGGFR